MDLAGAGEVGEFSSSDDENDIEEKTQEIAEGGDSAPDSARKAAEEEAKAMAAMFFYEDELSEAEKKNAINSTDDGDALSGQVSEHERGRASSGADGEAAGSAASPAAADSSSTTEAGRRRRRKTKSGADSSVNADQVSEKSRSSKSSSSKKERSSSVANAGSTKPLSGSSTSASDKTGGIVPPPPAPLLRGTLSTESLLPGEEEGSERKRAMSAAAVSAAAAGTSTSTSHHRRHHQQQQKHHQSIIAEEASSDRKSRRRSSSKRSSAIVSNAEDSGTASSIGDESISGELTASGTSPLIAAPDSPGSNAGDKHRRRHRRRSQLVGDVDSIPEGTASSVSLSSSGRFAALASPVSARGRRQSVGSWMEQAFVVASDERVKWLKEGLPLPAFLRVDGIVENVLAERWHQLPKGTFKDPDALAALVCSAPACKRKPALAPLALSCQHVVCSSCLESAADSTTLCPACQQPCTVLDAKGAMTPVSMDSSVRLLSESTSSRILRSDLEQLAVCCPLGQGVHKCVWNGKLEGLLRHVVDDCDYMPVPCPYDEDGCSAKLVRCMLRFHSRVCEMNAAPMEAPTGAAEAAAAAADVAEAEAAERAAEEHVTKLADEELLLNQHVGSSRAQLSKSDSSQLSHSVRDSLVKLVAEQEVKLNRVQAQLASARAALNTCKRTTKLARAGLEEMGGLSSAGALADVQMVMRKTLSLADPEQVDGVPNPKAAGTAVKSGSSAPETVKDRVLSLRAMVAETQRKLASSDASSLTKATQNSLQAMLGAQMKELAALEKEAADESDTGIGGVSQASDGGAGGVAPAQKLKKLQGEMMILVGHMGRTRQQVARPDNDSTVAASLSKLLAEQEIQMKTLKTQIELLQKVVAPAAKMVSLKEAQAKEEAKLASGGMGGGAGSSAGTAATAKTLPAQAFVVVLVEKSETVSLGTWLPETSYAELQLRCREKLFGSQRRKKRSERRLYFVDEKSGESIDFASLDVAPYQMHMHLTQGRKFEEEPFHYEYRKRDKDEADE